MPPIRRIYGFAKGIISKQVICMCVCVCVCVIDGVCAYAYACAYACVCVSGCEVGVIAVLSDKSK